MAEIRRPLSAVERWYWLSDQFSALNVISRVRVHGQLSIDDLRRGLDALQARHPLLRARIEHDAGLDPRWVPCERPIPLREVRGGGEEQWLREINERELPERIDPDSGPLIRTVAIATDAGAHDLLVVVPHIIADGTTVLTLAEQWLTLAADPPRNPGPPAPCRRRRICVRAASPATKARRAWPSRPPRTKRWSAATARAGSSRATRCRWKRGVPACCTGSWTARSWNSCNDAPANTAPRYTAR